MNQQAQQQQVRPMTLMERIDLTNNIVQQIMFLPALSVMVFIRRGIGFRLLKRWYISITGLFIWVVSFLTYDPTEPHPHAMGWFALAVFVLGFAHKIRRWWEVHRGSTVHSYSPGTSILLTKRSPRILVRYHRMNRFADPFMVILVGLFVLYGINKPLGAWLLISGALLFSFEYAVYLKTFDRDLDVADGLIGADVQSDVVKHFRPGAEGAATQDAGHGIPTGVGPDITVQRKRFRYGNRSESGVN